MILIYGACAHLKLIMCLATHAPCKSRKEKAMQKFTHCQPHGLGPLAEACHLKKGQVEIGGSLLAFHGSTPKAT